MVKKEKGGERGGGGHVHVPLFLQTITSWAKSFWVMCAYSLFSTERNPTIPLFCHYDTILVKNKYQRKKRERYWLISTCHRQIWHGLYWLSIWCSNPQKTQRHVHWKSKHTLFYLSKLLCLMNKKGGVLNSMHRQCFIKEILSITFHLHAYLQSKKVPQITVH